MEKRLAPGEPKRMASGGRMGWPELALVLGTAALSSANGWWVWTARRGLPYSIDEAGYLQRAIRDGQHLVQGGVGGLLTAIHTPDIQAPLVPVVASLAYPLVHANLLELLISLQVFYVTTALATYALAKLVLPRWWSALVALAVVCSPGVLDQSRSFMFAEAATATFAAALAAQIAAGNGRSRRLLVLAGVLSGLTMLSRTMMVAFIVVLWAVGLLAVILEPCDRWSRLRRFLLVPLVGSAVAAVWYTAQWRYVLEYLTSYGYGHTAALYQGLPMLPVVGSLATRLNNIVSRDLYLPLAAAVVVGLCLGGWSAVSAWRTRRVSLWRSLVGPWGQIALVTGGELAVLCSTANSGSGFELPLVPPLVVLAAAGWRSAVGPGVGLALCRGALATVAAASVATVVIKTVTAIPLMTVTLGGGAYSPVVESSYSVLGEYLSAFEHSGGTMSKVARGPWLADSWRVNAFMYHYARGHGYLPVVFFATEGPLFNTNTLQLEEQARRDRVLPMGVFRDPTQVGMSFVQQLNAPQYGVPNFLVAESGRQAERFTVVPDGRVAKTARQAKFQRVWSLRLPDGTWVTVYWRAVGPRIPVRAGGR